MNERKHFFLSAASSDFKATNPIQRENCPFPFTQPNFHFLKFSGLQLSIHDKSSCVDNSLVSGPISCMNISFDSSRRPLSKIFWVSKHQIKRSVAKYRKTIVKWIANFLQINGGRGDCWLSDFFIMIYDLLIVNIIILQWWEISKIAEKVKEQSQQLLARWIGLGATWTG